MDTWGETLMEGHKETFLWKNNVLRLDAKLAKSVQCQPSDLPLFKEAAL